MRAVGEERKNRAGQRGDGLRGKGLDAYIQIILQCEKYFYRLMSFDLHHNSIYDFEMRMTQAHLWSFLFNT